MAEQIRFEKEVKEIWAFFVVDDDGDEKIISTNAADGYDIPCLAFNEAHLQVGLDIVQETANHIGQKVIIRHFPISTIYASFDPESGKSADAT